MLELCNIWLCDTFGCDEDEDHIYLTSPEDDPVNSDSFGSESNRGIYGMLPKDEVIFKATGHLDKFNGSRCESRCHYNYGNEFRLWILD